ncbi:MAG: DnaJ domain-containing protein, partial [Gammaproteobacteria bacterium]
CVRIGPSAQERRTMNDKDLDFYRILHVSPDAPEEIIRSSYRTLMQRLKQHPDLGGDHENATLINEAYATLTDPKARSIYDKQRGSQQPDPGESTLMRSRTVNCDYEDTVSISLGGCFFCGAPFEKTEAAPADLFCVDCKSPLAMPEFEESNDTGLRALNRFSKEQPITFFDHWPSSEAHAATTHDISLKGMQFVTHVGLKHNQIIKIDCDVCRAVARVAHVSREGNQWVVGVEFATLSFNSSRGSFVSARA